MPSRRDDITMSTEELARFLDAQPFGVLGTIGPHGHPHQITMGFDRDGTERILMTSFAKSQKVRNAQRSSLGSFLVETGLSYGEIRGALFQGTLEVVTDRAQLAGWYYRMKEKSASLTPPDSLPPIDDERLIDKRVLLRLSAERVITWDHRKLLGVY
jgi:general stress protein 26